MFKTIFWIALIVVIVVLFGTWPLSVIAKFFEWIGWALSKLANILDFFNWNGLTKI